MMFISFWYEKQKLPRRQYKVKAIMTWRQQKHFNIYKLNAQANQLGRGECAVVHKQKRRDYSRLNHIKHLNNMSIVHICTFNSSRNKQEHTNIHTIKNGAKHRRPNLTQPNFANITGPT